MQWFWWAWLAGTLAAFGGIEAYALMHGLPTLSATMRNIGADHPWVMLLFGVFWLGLGIHFWAK
jgi:hypothetical protein